MATPALTRFGSDELKKTFLAPSIAGDILACIGVSEVGSGSDVASIKTTALPKRGTVTSTYRYMYNCVVMTTMTTFSYSMTSLSQVIV